MFVKMPSMALTSFLSQRFPSPHLSPISFQLPNRKSSFPSFPRKQHGPTTVLLRSFLVSSHWPLESSRIWVRQCMPEKVSYPFEQDPKGKDAFGSTQEVEQNEIDILKILKGANSIIPHIVLASTLLALIYPPSFTWFTTRYYAPALGFLMFAVGVNSSAQDFIQAINRPEVLSAGYVGQFVIKPLIGYLFGIISVTAFHLPTSLAFKAFGAFS